MKPLSIRTRLAVFYTGVFAVVLVIFAAMTYEFAAQRFRHEFDLRLNQVAAGLHGYLVFANGQPAFEYAAHDAEARYFIDVATQYVQVYEPADGRLLLESEASRLAGIALSPAAAKELAANVPEEDSENDSLMFDDVSSGGTRWRFHNAVVKDDTGRGYLLRVGTLMAPLDTALGEMGQTFLVMLPVGLLIGLLGGWWMARRALKPVDALQAVAHNIGISHLGSRLPLRGAHDELDRLAQTFNEMFARLETAVGQMRQFTAGIAHELRTPFSVLRGEAELALMQPKSVDEYRQVLATQLTEFARLQRMFDQLLLLARADAGEVKIEKAPVDLARLARSLVEQMKLVAEYNQVSLRVEGENSIEVVGDAFWLEPIILNLLDNAIKFTPAGGNVTVAVAPRGTQAALQFRDTGVGIPRDAIPHLFERFFRVDAARSRDIPGVGLGLTIVKWAVEAQGGVIEVVSEPGVGSCFTILLPRAAGEPGLSAAAIWSVPIEH